VTPGRPFQILALDGGGYRGLFSAAVLAAFEEDLGQPVVEHFDLVTGTSTGGSSPLLSARG
jgi:patatin-like phospholipase/acyl hydrolase